MFLELSHALMRPQGRMGMIVPSGIYTDKGTTNLRELFLDHCDWQWLFGFENREGIFDIHRSFKFCALIAQKAGNTEVIRTAFMRRNVDDWGRAEKLCLGYSAKNIGAFSPALRAMVELSSQTDVLLLQRTYEENIPVGSLDEAWEVDYGRELHMTDDSKLFPPRDKWVNAGYAFDDGLGIAVNQHLERYALPLYEGRMVGFFDGLAQSWESGKGRMAKWKDLPLREKVFRPQYLVSLEDCQSSEKIKRGLKLGVVKVSSATNSRSLKCSLIPHYPCGESVYSLQVKDASVSKLLVLQAVLCSFAFDSFLRYRFGGVNISAYLLKECPIPRLSSFSDEILVAIAHMAARLSFVSPAYSQAAVLLDSEIGVRVPPAGKAAALCEVERLRLRCILDATVAH
ncbi:MAG: hypothetical protein CFE49_19195, partial [Pseudomonas sp. PGPPP3]